MRDWQIRQRYGYGAARVPVPGVPYRCGAPPLPLLQGLAHARAERRAEGSRGPGAGLLRMLPLVLAAWLGLLAGGELLFRPGTEESEIALVPLELEQELAALETPEPEIELTEQAPAPEPVPELVPVPEPEPVVVAEAAEPEPEPEAEPAPEPEPESPRPRVQIDALAQRPTPAADSQRRAAREAPVELAAVPAPDLSLDALDAPEELAPRESRLRPTAPERNPVPRGAPPLPSWNLPVHEGASAPIRVARSTPRATPSSAPPRPQLAFAGVPTPERDPALPAPSGATRASRGPAPRNRRTPTGPRPQLAPAKLDLGGSGAESRTAPAPSRNARAALAAPAPARSAAAGHAAGLQGVPLGSLRACVSDAREDALKQRLMAAVTPQQQCSSDAGRYRFVETKNLNAFLMWIERAPGRREADRCGELSLALECLAEQKRKESRPR